MSNGEPAGGERRRSVPNLISVVVPCFNEAAVLPVLRQRLEQEVATWPAPWEIILVDDGSRDETWDLLVAFHRQDPRWKLVRLARNFGHQVALRAGLAASAGDLVAVLDADLQDPPELLPAFFAKWREGFDVIFGVRRNRKENWFLRTAYRVFYRVLSWLSEESIPLDTGDFSVMDRRIVELVCRMPERRPFLRGLRSWVGFRQTAIEYDRASRAAGQPKYDFKKLLALAIDGILSSSTVPLRMATFFGLGVSAISFLIGTYAILLGLFPALFGRLGMAAVPGTISVISSIMFLGGVQLICLGICGEYIGRIYDNVKGRPFWTVEESVGLDDRTRSRLSGFPHFDRRAEDFPTL